MENNQSTEISTLKLAPSRIKEVFRHFGTVLMAVILLNCGFGFMYFILRGLHTVQ